jgi:hypothetical protein
VGWGGVGWGGVGVGAPFKGVRVCLAAQGMQSLQSH